MRKKTALIFILLLVSIVMVGCFSNVARYDGSFKGRVVDAETGDPIEGVVVLGVWYTDIHTISGAKGKFYDAKEVVTDESGNFTIPGKGPRVLSNLRPVDLTIFKSGYSYTGGTKYSFTNTDKIKWEGNRALITLKKLTREERENQSEPPYPPTEAPLAKVILLLKEINKYRTSRGAGPIDIWRGEKL